jgi:hypothetical protein
VKAFLKPSASMINGRSEMTYFAVIEQIVHFVLPSSGKWVSLKKSQLPQIDGEASEVGCQSCFHLPITRSISLTNHISDSTLGRGSEIGEQRWPSAVWDSAAVYMATTHVLGHAKHSAPFTVAAVGRRVIAGWCRGGGDCSV